MREVKTIRTVHEWLHDIYQPRLFRIHNFIEKEAFYELLDNEPGLVVYDEIEGQLRELIKSLHPSRKIKPEEYPALIEQHLNGAEIDDYGVWVHYPWSGRVVHILDEEEFVEVRTNRNRYKITREEQALLASKKTGIVGLSVGQSIALTMAIERTSGELRLADFDTVELSNLNRMRAGVYNLGVRKTVVAAREISEIDPFIKVKIFNQGLTTANIDSFFLEDGKLDMLVEVCDGLDVKILSRFKARELGIPVVMDTNDRGMLDVERFDLEPERPILHGLAGDLDPVKIGDLTNEQKIPYILTMIGAETISTRLKASMLEVEQSINTWPQLASSVTLGGAITTDVCRNIFLDYFHDSGRYYVDLDDIVKNKQDNSSPNNVSLITPPPALQESELLEAAHVYFQENSSPLTKVSEDQRMKVLEAARFSPSGGNAQPWKFLWQADTLLIFHDAHYSHSLLDFNRSGSMIAFGAMLTNINIAASSAGLRSSVQSFPLGDRHSLIAAVKFSTDLNAEQHPLAEYIGIRNTNRVVSERIPLQQAHADLLARAASEFPAAKLEFFDTEDALKTFDDLLTDTERLRFIHPQGHYDTFVNELRFTQEEILATADGMDVNTLNLKASDIAALTIARDPKAISFLHKQRKGSGFKKISSKNVLAASAICVLCMPGDSETDFLEGGKALELVWLEATRLGVAFQPISQIIFMTELLSKKGSELLNSHEKTELTRIREQFTALLPDQNLKPVFVFRLCYSDTPAVKALRKPLERLLTIAGE